MSELCEGFIEHYLRARQILVQTVADDPQARVGEWNTDQILMHVASWDREATGFVPGMVRGEPEPEYDDDTFNAAAVERLGRLTPAKQRAEFEAAGEAFVAMLRSLPEEAFEDGAPASSWAAGLTGHALEHAEAIYHAE